MLRQDKRWFNAPALAQTLVKDADDAPTLVTVVLGPYVVVLAMMGLGFLWVMVWGWQLTLWRRNRAGVCGRDGPADGARGRERGCIRSRF